MWHLFRISIISVISLHDRRFMSQAGWTRYFARSATRARSARQVKEKNKNAKREISCRVSTFGGSLFSGDLGFANTCDILSLLSEVSYFWGVVTFGTLRCRQFITIFYNPKLKFLNNRFDSLSKCFQNLAKFFGNYNMVLFLNLSSSWIIIRLRKNIYFNPRASKFLRLWLYQYWYYDHFLQCS